ncbi:hypothetical protein MMC34_004682 [Xylographa carneopallida]|nr:hypothetical protein [Xylographa carneopallida]
MAFWPFGRKKRKTNPQGDSKMAITRAQNSSDARMDPGRSMTDVNARASSRSIRKNSQRRTRTTPSKVLTKAAPHKTRDLEKTSSALPVPVLPQTSQQTTEQFNEKSSDLTYTQQSRQPLAAVPTNQEDTDSYYFQNPTSQTSIQPEKFDFTPIVPTLQGKRSVHDKNLPRRKSSKRKAEDLVRQQEIKALSSPVPIPKRPQSHGAGLLTRESKRIPGGLNRNFQRPLSEVSLPLQESLHSSNSGMPDSHGFKVSALDVLSPRPTIKYSENPRWTAGGSNLGASRTLTKKDKRPSLPGDGVNSRARIKDLADELDAGSLREVMERDQRRRETKRKNDREKLQRRLQRKAEKQKAESRADQLDPAVSTGFPRDGLGVKIPELPAQQNNSPMLEPSKDREEAKSPDSWLDDASRDNEPLENPFDDRTGASHLEPPTPEKDEPVIETAKAVRLSAASMSPPMSPNRTHVRGPSNLSTLDDLASRSTPDVAERLRPEDARRGSDTSSRLAGSWTSFFRRSGTRGARNSSEHGRATPSEFSNTSRESFVRQAPPPVFIRNVRERSGTPVRTQSKFREDLPELPISPPVSRIQSPELAGSSPYIDHASKLPIIGDATSESAPRLSDVHPAYREEVAQSIRGASPDLPVTNIMTQSMASVDSEGSWLSGRPPKRSSQQLNPLRTSGGSLTQNLPEELSNVDEDRGAPENSTVNRGTSGNIGMYVPGYFISQINARGTPTGDESDYEEATTSPEATSAEEALKMSSVVGRHPTIVRRSMRARSREGLLDDFGIDDSSASTPSADSPIDPLSRVRDVQKEGSSIHRATSVDLGKSGHARHISAGSARLLDLPPRSSTEHKRLSTGSGEKSPLHAVYDTADTAPQS